MIVSMFKGVFGCVINVSKALQLFLQKKKKEKAACTFCTKQVSSSVLSPVVCFWNCRVFHFHLLELLNMNRYVECNVKIKKKKKAL